MALVSLQNLEMSFLDRLLFTASNINVYENDRIGFIGENGSGKTTLFRLLCGELEPTSGQVIISKSTKIGYAEQHACRDLSKTAYEEMLTVFSHLSEMEKELNELHSKVDAAKGEELSQLIAKQDALTERFQREGGLTYKNMARSALLGLGFSEEEINSPVGNLSGGQRTKISLGKLLLSDSDLILLDEPTNHLDINSVEWLEGFLQNFKGAFIVISHDRYFLDRVTDKTLEIYGKKLYLGKGSFTRYMELKEERLLSEQREYEKTLKEIKRLEDIIEQQRRFNRERNYIVIASREKQIERLKENLGDPPVPPSKAMRLKFEERIESPNEVLTIREISKSYGEKRLFSNLSLTVKKGERLMIVGPNGCGKSTLIKIIAKHLTPDTGAVFYGPNIVVGYFDQTLSGLNDENSCIEEVYNSCLDKSIPELRNYLAAFNFKGDDIEKKVGSLSGGEKAKLALLKLMLKRPNLLILDEPTNHLDIMSREALEQALSDYSGTIIAVSHDRYFINRLATNLLAFTADVVKEIDGNYDSYLSFQQGTAPESSKPEKKVNEYKRRKEEESLRRKRQTRLKKIEAELQEVSKELEETNTLLQSPEVASDYERLTELTAKLSALSEKEEELLAEYLQLEEILSEQN
ncbi:MAG TPA: ABC-F family ATP-binding cassette domain-containing protein [Clostridiales bacterium]|jgi:ATP-binding cassette subfamily F protein 3|nr:ABC-F family ATP-binding cassette domain-containing protein [Clostridiales bacterium]HOL78792.1 ABC-F family ATP-binding cassette domain-containing protein [Clostridiales bacterium]HPP67466.1 ABC-F family ATP-binding cassette domain-containing protein [Clostridiales bacterium]HQA04953.1 ABC-F family ATP-binding cassette domain-containing protein [Clostridiales bacterium]HQD72208.1 ABC-F family ATP-binding cassette domain-containing protein [Clostridiales bacterium]